MSNRALFLDRDGVVNEDHGFVHRAEDIVFQRGILELGRYFTSRNWKIIIVTNQSGIARGLYGPEDVEKVHAFIREKFAFHKVNVTDFFFCPHYPPLTGPCGCRKPEPGMILEAAGKHDIDLANSLLVGDKDTDMAAADAAGVGRKYFLQGKYEHNPRYGGVVVGDLREIIDMEKENHDLSLQE